MNSDSMLNLSVLATALKTAVDGLFLSREYAKVVFAEAIRMSGLHVERVSSTPKTVSKPAAK